VCRWPEEDGEAGGLVIGMFGWLGGKRVPARLQAAPFPSPSTLEDIADVSAASKVDGRTVPETG